ncbi:MAG: cation:proton antiporter [Pseudobdellovibrio sp.]
MIFLLLIFLGFLLGSDGFDLISFAKVAPIFSIAGSLFLFSSGLELSLSDLKEEFSKKFILSIAFFFVPIAIAYFLLTYLFTNTAGDHVFFVAMALSVTALPVIIQILKENKLNTTILGKSIISYAIFSDIFAWLLFSFMLPQDHVSSWLISHLAVILFFAGILLSRFNTKLNLLHISSKFLWAPLFFIGLGMSIHLSKSFSALSFFAILFLAISSKSFTVYIFGRIAGYRSVTLDALTVSLNARGAMAILLAHFAFQAAIIDETILTSFVLMSLLTSAFASIFFAIKKKQLATL